MSKDLAIRLYKTFDSCKNFALKDQICRAWLSISTNIAEWYERQSQKELKQFLYIAKWSSWEVRSLLIIAHELDIISKSQYNELYALTESCSKMLAWFIKKIGQNL